MCVHQIDGGKNYFSQDCSWKCVVYLIFYCYFKLDLGILSFVGEKEFRMKPAIREAFKAAKNVDDCKDDDYVERSEFRALMIALR